MRKYLMNGLSLLLLSTMLLGCGGGANHPAAAPAPSGPAPAVDASGTGAAPPAPGTAIAPSGGATTPTGTSDASKAPGTSDASKSGDPASAAADVQKPAKNGGVTDAVNPPAPYPDLDTAEKIWLVSARKQMAPPVDVKGIYVSGSMAGTSGFNDLLALVDRTELNAMVVDIKSDWGPLTYHSSNPLAIALGEQGSDISNLTTLIKKLHDHHVYVIGRLVSFKDNTIAKSHPDWMLKNQDGRVWVNYGQSTWMDPTNQNAWRYLVSVGKEAAAAGIDEIQFDYVRFPSDGPMNQLVYPDLKGKEKAQVIGDFLGYARKELHPYGVRISADVFGLVTSVPDDMGIGQHLEDAAASVDYLSPMTYPSHYGPGNLGQEWPNNAPYAILKRSMDDALGRVKAAGLTDVQIRPWLQDFTWGPKDNPAVEYGPKQVRAEIQAVYDGGGKSWLLWNAGNVYTEGALLPKGKQ